MIFSRPICGTSYVGRSPVTTPSICTLFFDRTHCPRKSTQSLFSLWGPAGPQPAGLVPSCPPSFSSQFIRAEIWVKGNVFDCPLFNPCLIYFYLQYNAAIASNPVRPALSGPQSRYALTSTQYIVGSFACIGGGLFGLDISSMSAVLSVRLIHVHSEWACVNLLSERRIQDNVRRRV